MPRYLLIALNSPTTGEGDDAAYNEWYDTKHVPDLQSITGNVSCRRLRIVRQNRIDKQYIAVSEFEAESAEALMAELAEKASDFTDKIDRTSSIFVLGEELPPA